MIVSIGDRRSLPRLVEPLCPAGAGMGHTVPTKLGSECDLGLVGWLPESSWSGAESDCQAHP